MLKKLYYYFRVINLNIIIFIQNRLRCLRYVVHALPGDPMQQLFQNNATISSSEVLAEIIVCVKELNKAAREEAFKLLTTISERCAIHYEDS